MSDMPHPVPEQPQGQTRREFIRKVLLTTAYAAPAIVSLSVPGVTSGQGQSDSAPGQSGSAPGQSGSAPGLTGSAPGLQRMRSPMEMMGMMGMGGSGGSGGDGSGGWWGAKKKKSSDIWK